MGRWNIEGLGLLGSLKLRSSQRQAMRRPPLFIGSSWSRRQTLETGETSRRPDLVLRANWPLYDKSQTQPGLTAAALRRI